MVVILLGVVCGLVNGRERVLVDMMFSFLWCVCVCGI